MKKTLLILALLLPRLLGAEAPVPIKLAILVEFTGDNAANGLDCRQGAAVAEKQFAAVISARKVEILFADHRGDAKTGVAEFKKAVEFQDAWAVIAQRSQVGMPLNPLSLQTKTLLLGIVGHPRFLSVNPYAFRFYPAVEREGPLLADLAWAEGAKTAAVLSAEDEWTLALEKPFTARFRALGGRIETEMTIPIDLPELSSVVSKLKVKNPGVIFVNLTMAQTGDIIKRLREQGFAGKIVTNFWGAHSDSITKAGVENIEGAVFAQINLDRPVFVRRLRDENKVAVPTSVTYACYSALAALLHTIESHPEIRSKAELCARLRELPSIPLLDENLGIKDREVQFEVIGKVIRGGRAADLGLRVR